jgi:hypothetical protein
MFPAFERCFRSTETEAKAKRFIIHLGASRKFSLYFKDVGVSKCDWVRNPLDANNFSRLTTCEQEQLIDTFCDGSLKDILVQINFLSFGCLGNTTIQVYQTKQQEFKFLVTN